MKYYKSIRLRLFRSFTLIPFTLYLITGFAGLHVCIASSTFVSLRFGQESPSNQVPST